MKQTRGLEEGQTAKVVRNGEGGSKQGWKPVTRKRESRASRGQLVPFSLIGRVRQGQDLGDGREGVGHSWAFSPRNVSESRFSERTALVGNLDAGSRSVEEREWLRSGSGRSRSTGLGSLFTRHRLVGCRAVERESLLSNDSGDHETPDRSLPGSTFLGLGALKGNQTSWKGVREQ